MEERVGALTFISNFDSGNLARVEKVKPEESTSSTEDDGTVLIVPDYDYNVWTSPDCAGMECENANRTWFYFGVKGGQPGKLLRINIMNLNRQGKLYSQGMTPLVKAVPSRNKWERLREKPKFETIDGQFRLSFMYRFPDQRNGVHYFAFCYPHSYSECQAKLEELDKTFAVCKQMTPLSPQDSIYFCRELLCNSLDGLRVDLLTVSSVGGMMEEREEYLPNLFPERSVPRAHRFNKKKVFFLSARVHPGETPSSFVFNGFLDFVLRNNDPRAAALRNQYVFKLIPMLNPDGVKRGHYRTDPRGVNLNRVYTDPDPLLHPSIFAAKSIILYHHTKGVLHETSNLVSGCACDTGKGKVEDTSQTTNSEALSYSLGQEGDLTNSLPILAELKPGSPDSEFVKLELQSVVSNTTAERDDNNNKENNSDKVCDVLESLVLQDRVLPPLQTNPPSTDNHKMDVLIRNNLSNESASSMSNDDCSDQQSKACATKLPPKKTLNGNNRKECDNNCFPKASAETNSGIAFYVDLHGHASKRGCFVYANFLENEDNYVNSILFPKLVSLNSANFDFAACNFTEKNMYSKDKRDGMSKEGSGRVAIHKATGMVHSYTLECNYNCGRMVNPLPPATCDNGYATPPPPPGFPPKYTTDIYEEVGRALAIAVLDMRNTNPWSRLPLSEFTSLEGVRNWVKRFLKSSKNAPSVPKKLSRIITKTSSMVAGATASTRHKVSVLTSSSSEISSDNFGNGGHRATDHSQQKNTTSTKEPGKKATDDTRLTRRPPPLTSTRKSSLQGACTTAKNQESSSLPSGPLHIGTNKDPLPGSGPTKSHVYKSKEPQRVSLELPKTGPTLRLVHNLRPQHHSQHISPSGKSFSPPAEIKMSTIDVHKQFIGFHRGKADPLRNGHSSHSDEEKKKKSVRTARKKHFKRKEKVGELTVGSDRQPTHISLPRPCAEEVADLSSPQTEEEEKTTRPQLPKRNSSKSLINCSMMSCEVVDIKELPHTPQSGSSTSLTFWANTSVT